MTGIDPNLVYASRGAIVSRDQATLISSAAQQKLTAGRAAVTLLATPLRAFSVSFREVVRGDATDDSSAEVTIWSVFARAGFVLRFNSATMSIQTESVVHGETGQTLVGGTVTRSHVLGAYESGRSYEIRADVDRARAITFSVLRDGLAMADSVAAPDFPELFHSNRLALTVSARASAGVVKMTLSNYVLRLPHQSYWTTRLDDRRERAFMQVVLVLIGLIIVAAGLNWVAQRHHQRGLRRGTGRRILLRLAYRRRIVVSWALAIIAYLIGNALLFQLGGHPFDIGVEKLYAYVARDYGPVQLYYLPNTVSMAGIWGGVPYIESAFPYEPAMAYLSTAIGWLYSVIFAGGSGINLGDVGLEYMIKAVNVSFGLADAALIYLILNRLGASERARAVGVALFLFNPAVWFSMSVWGQTHVISIFFVLASILLVELNIPLWAWVSLAIACLTRPQMLVFGFLLGIIMWRKFSWSRNANAISWTVIIAFTLLAPFTLFTSPTLPIDIMANVFRIQEAGGNESVLTTVSQDAYSVWPLITYLAHGTSGLQRAFTPSSEAVIGPLTYQRLSQVLTTTALLAVSGGLLLRKSTSSQPGGYLPLVTLGIMSFLMLLTGLTATHFLLALPVLVLTHRWLGGVAYFYVVAIWTATTLVPMFGDMGVAVSTLHYPLLAPNYNMVTRFVVQIYTGDRFITLAVVANICALLWVTYIAFRPTWKDRPSLAAQP